ncbi:MAG: hypothetical protein OXC40_05225, partial [Proteobacteria bacterium]|nr:hypothetical protein [Pseudomonadota bacterium]
EELLDSGDFQEVADGAACTEQASKSGNVAALSLCGLGTFLAAKKKLKLLQQLSPGKLQVKFEKWRNMFNSGFGFEGMSGLVNNYLGPAKGSPIGFGINIMNAFQDLAATHVTLPCEDRQKGHVFLNKAFLLFLPPHRQSVCTVFEKIKQRRIELGLEEPTVDICEEIHQEKTALETD